MAAAADARVRKVSSPELDVLVIGAGVSGLTTAVCLAESGRSVVIRADRPPRQTTSSVAGAIWGPHMVERSDRATRWSRETLGALTDLATDPGSGVRLVSGIEATRTADGLPHWAHVLGNVSPADPARLPAAFTAGWRYTAPVVSMPVYLDYLLSRFRRAGGQVQEAAVTSLGQAARDTTAQVIVNCPGIGARDLVPDPAVTPVRGQVVVAANPGVTEFFIGLGDGSAELTYVFPHGDTVILGGTEERGNWSLDPDPSTAQRILRDCRIIDPRLGRASVIAHRVGLRPVRPEVRLEAEPPGAGPLVVHNYGHGGAGITLSWGCAREVTELIQAGPGPVPGRRA
jgi:D-amino-acid oxidase